jgi:hypothetical protein
MDIQIKISIHWINPSCIHKEILLTIDFQQRHINEFLRYCGEQFVGNSKELKDIEKIEKEYHHYQPIWWYKYNCFQNNTMDKTIQNRSLYIGDKVCLKQTLIN